MFVPFRVGTSLAINDRPWLPSSANDDDAGRIFGLMIFACIVMGKLYPVLMDVSRLSGNFNVWKLQKER